MPPTVRQIAALARRAIANVNRSLVGRPTFFPPLLSYGTPLYLTPKRVPVRVPVHPQKSRFAPFTQLARPRVVRYQPVGLSRSYLSAAHDAVQNMAIFARAALAEVAKKSFVPRDAQQVLALLQRDARDGCSVVFKAPVFEHSLVSFLDSDFMNAVKDEIKRVTAATESVLGDIEALEHAFGSLPVRVSREGKWIVFRVVFAERSKWEVEEFMVDAGIKGGIVEQWNRHRRRASSLTSDEVVSLETLELFRDYSEYFTSSPPELSESSESGSTRDEMYYPILSESLDSLRLIREAVIV